MPTFSTSFTPPPAVAGLNVEADVDASAVLLTWDPTTIAQVDFGGYRVSRSRDNGISWELLAHNTLVNDVDHADYSAPLNIPLLYRVTQSNLDFESEGAEAGVELASLMWWVVVPGDASATFGVPRHQEAALEGRKVQDVFSPLGRRGKVIVGDVVQAEDGQLTFLAMPDNLGVIELLRRVQSRMEGGVTLKATDGSVWQVQYGDIRRSFQKGGIQELSIPFYGVD
jgi:hypothetical protein